MSAQPQAQPSGYAALAGLRETGIIKTQGFHPGLCYVAPLGLFIFQAEPTKGAEFAKICFIKKSGWQLTHTNHTNETALKARHTKAQGANPVTGPRKKSSPESATYLRCLNFAKNQTCRNTLKSQRHPEPVLRAPGKPG